jgi:hypothetical protein
MIWLLLLAAMNAAYLAALPSPTVFYIANEVLHLALGAAVVVWLGVQWRRRPAVAPLLIGGLLGLYLVFAGATRDHRWALWSHIALAVIGLAILLPRWRPALAVLTVAAATLRFATPRIEFITPKWFRFPWLRKEAALNRHSGRRRPGPIPAV